MRLSLLQNHLFLIHLVSLPLLNFSRPPPEIFLLLPFPNLLFFNLLLPLLLFLLLPLTLQNLLFISKLIHSLLSSITLLLSLLLPLWIWVLLVSSLFLSFLQFSQSSWLFLTSFSVSFFIIESDPFYFAFIGDHLVYFLLLFFFEFSNRRQLWGLFSFFGLSAVRISAWLRFWDLKERLGRFVVDEFALFDLFRNQMFFFVD